MKVKIFAILILVFLFFVGCVSTKNVPIADNFADDLRNHTIACTEREAPDFSVDSPGKSFVGSLFGPIGGAIAGASMVSEGNKIIRENGVEDPADYIAVQLMSGLTAKYQLNQVNVNGSILESDDVEDISSLYKDADYVLDVKTASWATGPWHSGAGTVGPRYLVGYGSKLRLIDTKERTIIAEGFCNGILKQDARRFSYDELIDNNAEALKNELKVKADYCVDQFKKNVFMLQ